MNYAKNVDQYNRRHVKCNNEPVRCHSCNLLYSDDKSYLDHLLCCTRIETKPGKKYRPRQAQGIAA